MTLNKWYVIIMNIVKVNFLSYDKDDADAVGNMDKYTIK